MSVRTMVSRVLGRPGKWIVLAYIALPLALFGIPAAFGVPWLLGDNLIQNYPLRVLVGIDLRHAHLPLWNPYLWSGSPLLAGFNAGAAYPTTFLFAILPSALAWVTNQVAAQAIAAIGMLVLVRVLGRSWLAAGLAAGAFAYGGFMAQQTVHIDLVQAGAWLPWAFVALDRLAHRPTGRPIGRWVALLACSLGLMALTGAVEPLLDSAVVLVVYAAWLAWRTSGRRTEIALGTVLGGVLGVMIGALQLLPGSMLQAESQRSVANFTYFASGSMNKSLTLLGLDPLLFGGAHSFPIGYYATYNLPEVSSYIGIMAVMALFGLLSRRHWRSADAATWRIWYVVLGLGLVMTWGHFTPLGHLFYEIPFYNRQRLLARNLLEVDLAAAILFGIWVDRTFVPVIARARSQSAQLTGDPHDQAIAPARWRARHPGSPIPGGWTSDVVLPLVPVVAVVALQVIMLCGGTWFPHVLHVPAQLTRSKLWPLVGFLTIPTVVALCAGWLFVRRENLGTKLPVLIASLLFVDLAIFNVVTQTFPDPQSAISAGAPWANQLSNSVSATGTGPAGGEHRMALYNPEGFHPLEVDRIGPPDMTILRNIDSVQGYGAIVSGKYDLATGSHQEGNLNLAALSGNTFRRLDLSALVTLPAYFMNLESATKTAEPVMSGAGGRPNARRSVSLSGSRNVTQYFGATLRMTKVSVPVSATAPASTVRIGLLQADGSGTKWLTATTPVGPSATTVTAVADVETAHGAYDAADGLVFRTTGRVSLGRASLSTSDEGTYKLDGALVDAVTGPTWRTDGQIGIFPLFTTSSAAGRAWVQPPAPATTAATLVPRAGTTAASGADGSARVVSDTSWGGETIEIHAASASTLVRSEGYDPGWRATIARANSSGTESGAVRSVPVTRSGVVQAVEVPAGTWLVTFKYKPRSVSEGFALTVAGLAGALALALLPASRRRRLRRRAPRRLARGQGRTNAGSPPGPAKSVPEPCAAAPGPVPTSAAGKSDRRLRGTP